MVKLEGRGIRALSCLGLSGDGSLLYPIFPIVFERRIRVSLPLSRNGCAFGRSYTSLMLWFLVVDLFYNWVHSPGGACGRLCLYLTF